jgi:hypothetical protein
MTNRWTISMKREERKRISKGKGRETLRRGVLHNTEAYFQMLASSITSIIETAWSWSSLIGLVSMAIFWRFNEVVNKRDSRAREMTDRHKPFSHYSHAKCVKRMDGMFIRHTFNRSFDIPLGTERSGTYDNHLVH